MGRILSLLFVICPLALLTAQTNFKNAGQPDVPVPRKSEMTGFTPKACRLFKHSQTQSSKFVRRVKNNNLPADKAEIILEARDVWETGTIGYQLLLDAGHDTFGELYDASSSVYEDDYAPFEYKIPEEAEPDQTTDKVIINGEGKVLIPAGIYDYLITCPMPGDGIMLPSGEFARFDDFKFEGGFTYRFRVSMQQTELGITDRVEIFADQDACIRKLTLPANSMNLTANEPITVVIDNRGISPIGGFPVSYRINEGKAVTETFTGNIPAGEAAAYTFIARADFSAEKIYEVKAYTELHGDLIPYNDAMRGKCKHIGVAALPYTYDFSSPEDFGFDWTVVNANEDFSTWEYGEWWESPDKRSYGAAQCPTYGEKSDDYLISLPIHLDQGNNYLTFYARGVRDDLEELLDVRYGTTPRPEAMTIIGEYAFKDSEYWLKAANFKVPATGTYYFAFHAKSVSGANIIMDDVTIDKGIFKVSPDIVIEKVLLPYSNCDLSDRSRIGARLSNKGTGPASSITLSYTVDKGKAVTQTFTGILNTNESKAYYFDTPADLLDLKDYYVEVTSTCEGETFRKGGSVIHYAPVSEFPHTTDFYLNSGIEGYWTQMTEGTWQYDQMGGYYASQASGTANGLLSRCFTLNHPFRIKIAYTGGYFSTPASFYIAYGKPGTDVASWKKVYEDNNILHDVETEFSIYPDTPGEYSIAIINTSENSTSLYQFTLSEILEYDLRVSDVESPLAPYMPVNHLRQEGTYRVTLENRGSKSMTGIHASLNKGTERQFVTENQVTIKSSATDTLLLKGKLSNLIPHQEITLNIDVNGNETEMYPADNVWLLPTVHLTDTVFATEHLTSFTLGTGLNGETSRFGNIYTLTETDTLTSVFVGMAKDNYYTPADMGVAVYSLKDDGTRLDRKLFSTTFERQAEGSFREIGFVPRELPAGKYYFEVQQLTYKNIGLAYEMADGSFFYQNINDTLHRIDGYGNIAVRAHFGHGANVYKKNAAVLEIVRPLKSKALFSSDETIEATVENSGTETITDMTVSCLVNGVEKSVKVTLAPYEQKAVLFTTVDLSAPGEYNIRVYTAMNGDENPADNSKTRTLVCIPEANPYILDFESCDDFDTDHQLNPTWWTIDRVGFEVDSWWQFDYPHNSEPVGFIAFNTASTNPPMTDELNVPGFFPHSGKRFGAAFATTQPDTDSDAWLISPQLTLSSNSSLELYVKTFALESPDAKPERYKLLLSDTDDKFESFRILGDERKAPIDWTQTTVDLKPYDYKKVYIALQYVSKALEGVVMMVDDIRIISDGVGIRNTPADNGILVWTDSKEKTLSVSSGNQLKKLELYTLSGQNVYHSEEFRSSFFRLSLAGYEPGVYTIRLFTENEMKVVKFTIAP